MTHYGLLLRGRRAKFFTCVFTVMIFAVLPIRGQKISSYINDMREALVPYGKIIAPNCHNVEIDLIGPWGNFAIPDGVNTNEPDELTWLVLRVDVLRLYVNLSDLDEDKVQNQAIFSLDYISKHQKGTPYIADTPAVTISTSGLNTKMIAHIVDLDKVHALEGKTATESQMGFSLDERKVAIILFSDKAHADAFQKSIQKAIVVCKAQ